MSRPRTPLSERLSNAVKSSSSPRSSLDTDLPVEQPEMQKTAARLTATASTSSSKTPIVRWFESWKDAPTTSNAPQPPPSPSCSSSSAESGEYSPGLSLLNEALHENMPRKPSPAHRMPSWQTRALTRPPPFLDNLTRSTLPTSSVHSSYSDPFENTPSQFGSTSKYSPGSLNSRTGASRSSIDSLRSIHSSASNSFSATPPPSKWWFQSDNKKDVETLLNEDERGETAEDIQQNIRKKYHAPKNPIVFCHGLLGFDSVSIGPAIAPVQVTHWRGIKEVLEANGAEVLITRVPATSSPAERAKVLEEKISETYPGKSVHLIGHSMGGLDCRYMTTHLTHRKFKVLSITTIATPHRGSVFADYFLSTIGAARMPSFVSLLDMLPNGGGDGSAFSSLTIDAMKVFNETTPDVPGVQYASWGATYEPGLIDTWRLPHGVVAEKEGPNDGLVSITSSKWGTYLGTIEHVNHLDLVGWINPARYKWAQLTGKEITFRPGTFYLGVADWLALKVEGQEEEHEDGSGKGGKGETQAGAGVELGEDNTDASPTPGENTKATRTTSQEPGSPLFAVTIDEDETPTQTPSNELKSPILP